MSGRPRPLDETIRQRMVSTKRRDTGPEILVRSALHRAGLRFFVDRAPLRGLRARADMVFTRAKVAVFVNGCFWHGCSLHATWPKHNAAWWKDKIEGNRMRDARVDAALEAAGWAVVRVWEHEDPASVARRIMLLISQRQAART